jgi:pilus assembly protein CpaB
MIGRRASIALAIAASILAGVLYYIGAQRSPVVVAAHDLDAMHALTPDDLALIALPPDVVPAGTLTEVDAAIGMTPRAPLWKGQVVMLDALGAEAAPFHTGIALPSGMRAVALPVSAAQAVGGALLPGAHVDVLAVPVGGRAPAGRTTELLAESALVLDVRGETGAPYGIAKPALTGVNDRIASVVVAIPRLDEIRFADRIATSTFILALARTSD